MPFVSQVQNPPQDPKAGTKKAMKKSNLKMQIAK
jgi:hypothetical protein